MSDTSILPALACQLTTPELQQRKATVLARLKAQVLARKEISAGFAYQFAGTDAQLDELLSFVKTERLCCDFFTFTLIMSRNDQPVWLEITGPEGAKVIIQNELAL